MNADKSYDHYIGIDWSIHNMAIAHLTAKSDRMTVKETAADVGELRAYLHSLRGSKILTIEETTTAQWLHTELHEHVDRLLICDPRRNRLLSEGPKTDKIDAGKLVQLLRAGLLKEVFHTSHRFGQLRKLVSGYEDLVNAGVRLKNQRYALLRSCGLSGEEKGAQTRLKLGDDQLVLDCLERQIKAYQSEKRLYEAQFQKLAKRYPEIRHQTSLPGIGIIGAVKIVSRIVSPHRFADAGHFLSYAGLVKLERRSGLISYGRKASRYCRQLKSVYKTGVLAALDGSNAIHDCYEYLIREKGYEPHTARHKACRRLAVLSWGVFKSGKAYRRRDVVTQTSQT